MKRKIISIALCLCMALTLLPTAALATNTYSSWDDATADGVTLADGDAIAIGGMAYTYKGDVEDTGLTIITRPTAHTIYKAGDGYALFTPKVEGESPTPDTLTLNNATVAPTSPGAALVLGTADIKLVLEGSSSLTGTNNMALCATDPVTTDNVDVTIGGSGSLTLNGVSDKGSFHVGDLTLTDTATVTSPYGTAEGTVTVNSGATLNAVMNNAGAKTVYGTVTIAEGETKEYHNLTFTDGSEMVVNGTLTMTLPSDRSFDDVKAHLTGSGVVKVGTDTSDPSYIKFDGEWVNYGGDVYSTGLNYTSSSPAVKTAYKAGDGTVVWTPAGNTNAKLTFTDATISVSAATAVTLPDSTPVDVTFNGTNSISASTSGAAGIQAFSAQDGALTFTLAEGSSTTLAATSKGSSNVIGCGSVTINGSGELLLKPVVGAEYASQGYAIATSSDVTINSGTVYEQRSEATGGTHGTGGIVTGARKKVTLGAVTIPAGGTLDVHRAATLNFTENKPVINNGALVLPGSYTVNTIPTSITVSGVFTIDGIDYGKRNGVWVQDVTNTGLDLSTFPAVQTTYRAGSGYALFTPAEGSVTPTLTLYNATINGAVEGMGGGIKYCAGIFAANDLYIVLEEMSTVARSRTEFEKNCGILGGGSITISGNGSLTANGYLSGDHVDGLSENYGIYTGGALTIQDSAKVTATGGPAKDTSSGIFSNGAITVQGSATVTGSVVDNNTGAGTRYGIFGATSITITDDANVTGNAGNSVEFTGISSGICGGNLAISGNATVNANGGENGIDTYGLSCQNGTLAISGSAKVTATGGTSQDGPSCGINIESASSITISDSAKVTATGGAAKVDSYGIFGDTSLSVKDTATVNANVCKVTNTPTVDNTATLNALIMVGDVSFNIRLLTPTVYGKATIAENEERSCGKKVEWKDGSSLQMNGVLVLAGDTFDDVKDKITGSGIVCIATATDVDGNVTAWDAYLTDGTEIPTYNHGLDFSVASGDDNWTEGATLADNGYEFTGNSTDGYTLTLGNLYIKTTSGSAITLPSNGPVEVALTSGAYTCLYTQNDTAAALFCNGGTKSPVTISGGGRLLLRGREKALNVNSPLIITGGDIRAYGDFNKGFTAPDLTITGGTLTVSGSDRAFSAAPKFSGYTPRVAYGADAASATTAVSPADAVYTSNKYVKITKYVVSSAPTPETSEPEEPVTDNGATTVTATIKPTTSGTTATAAVPADTVTSAAQSAAEAAKENGTKPVVEIKIETPATATQVKAELPSAPLKTVADSNAMLTVTTGIGAVELDSKVLANVAEKAGDKPVTLTVEIVDPKNLTDEQQGAIGSTENTVVVDLTLTAGEEKISDLGGTVSVSVPYTPSEGEKTETLKVWFIADDGTITLCDGEYNAKTGSYVFKTNHLSAYVLAQFPFEDVSEGAWYYGNAVYAYLNGLFAGTSETTFEPETAMSRAMLVTVLWRMDGMPEAAQSDFADVASDTWYTKAVDWAAAKEIVEGSDGYFNPNDPITREQLATIIFRYAKFKGADTNVSGGMGLAGFNDASAVFSYAIDAMTWAVKAALVNGADGALMPQGSATRAQVAAILQRYNNR